MGAHLAVVEDVETIVLMDVRRAAQDVVLNVMQDALMRVMDAKVRALPFALQDVALIVILYAAKIVDLHVKQCAEDV